MGRERRVRLVLLILAVAVTLPACATIGEPPQSLYERLGGRDKIAVVVDDFVANVVADDRINTRFKGLTPPQVVRLKAYLADQICAGARGPCAYLGRDMKTTHEGMKITVVAVS